MFENTTPQTPPMNPLNPVMPAPGMSSSQGPTVPPPFVAPQPPVHTMPERFRSAGSTPGGPPGSHTTKKLIIILVVVVVVAGLGVAGLFIFNRVVKTNGNTANTGNTNVAPVNNNTAVTNSAVNDNANVNAPGGAGSGSAGNANENVNTAANVNSAANANQNINAANTNAASNTNTAANTNTAIATGPLPSSADADSDGLTNTEEAVYGTDVANADSDGDTFIDGKQIRPDGTVIGELANLYNPRGVGQLEGSGLVKRVENATKAFSLLVPTSWTTNESSGLLVVTPTTQTGEFFQVRVYDNAASQTPSQWYQANYPTDQLSLTKSVAVNGLEGLVSPDGSSVYLFKGTKIYGLTYTATGLSQLNYWTTFEMMMKSFKLVATS
ncbi:MAG: hypothetical protein AAB402_03285 [Patescibacteria group bacterium]